MIKNILLGALALFCIGQTEASTAKFKKIWIESNVKHQGKDGVMIYSDFDLNEAKGKLIECQAIFYASPGGRALRDLNNSYRLSPSLNYIATSEYFNATSSAMSVDSCRLFIPTEELHLKNPRKYRVFVKLSIYSNPGKAGEFLTDSDYIPFVVDASESPAGVSTFAYDPDAPRTETEEIVKQKTIKTDAPVAVEPEKPEEAKEATTPLPTADDYERDHKGRAKPRKAKVFL